MRRNSSRKKATPNRLLCRQSSPSRCLVLSGVGRNTKRASVSCHRRRSSHNHTTTTVRHRAPPWLPHPPIFRNLNGLWASSNISNNASKVPPLYLPPPGRQMRARLGMGSFWLRFLQRRPRGRIKNSCPVHISAGAISFVGSTRLASASSSCTNR